MRPGTVSARRTLVKTVQEIIIPAIKLRGFLESNNSRESCPNWTLHRKKHNGGFDLIDIWFDEGFRPSFMCYINTIDKQGVNQPWGEYVAADQATALDPLKRVMVMRKNRGVIRWLLGNIFRLNWFSHTSFSFKPDKNKSINIEKAKALCVEFLKCLEQAESWWKHQVIGANIIQSDILKEAWDQEIRRKAKRKPEKGSKT